MGQIKITVKQVQTCFSSKLYQNMICNFSGLVSHCFLYLQEEVMMYERVLLQTIKFDLQVEHPYPSLLKFGKALKGSVCFEIFTFFF